MKTKFLISIALLAIIASFATGCQKDGVNSYAYPITNVQQTGFCCAHTHTQFLPTTEEGPPYITRWYHCCGCKAVCRNSGAIEALNNEDTLSANSEFPGVVVDYIAQDETIPYTFTTNELGHWDTLNSVAGGYYNVRFTKSGCVTQTVYDVEVADNGYHQLFVEMEEE